MADLNLDTITRTATEVAQAYAFPVSVVASVPTSGGSRYIEIVLRVLGRDEPSPKRPQTIHYRGDGEFMISGGTINRRRNFRPENL